MTSVAILDQVIALVRETLGLAPDAPIEPTQLVFYDLSFTSLDLLDLLFRLEETFGISIPEGSLYALARGELPDELFADGTALTPTGRERLMALLADSPAPIFPASIHVQTLPRYCTVAAFARLVEAKLADKR